MAQSGSCLALTNHTSTRDAMLLIILPTPRSFRSSSFKRLGLAVHRAARRCGAASPDRPFAHRAAFSEDEGRSADFTAIALPGVCWRSIRSQVRRGVRCEAAFVSKPAVESQSEGPNSIHPFAGTWIDQRRAGLCRRCPSRVFADAALVRRRGTLIAALQQMAQRQSLKASLRR